MSPRLIWMGATAGAVVVDDVMVGAVYWTPADAAMRDGEPVVIGAGFVWVDGNMPSEHVYLAAIEKPTAADWERVAGDAVEYWLTTQDVA